MIAPGAVRTGIGSELRRSGPLALRAGHYLALRADAVGAAAREELLRFGDHVPPRPWAEVAPYAGRALGTDPTEVFTAVEVEASWSNAITQTHRARLLDGTPVLVKLVRPGAVEQLARAEPALHLQLTALVSRFGGDADPDAVATETLAWLYAQTDLTREAANLERMRAVAGEDRWERYPSVASSASGAELLVTSDLGGVRVGDVSAGWTAAEPPSGIGRARLARVPVLVLLRQALRHRRFCVDWHPDTVIALPGDLVTFADWTLVAELDADLAEQLGDYLSAVFGGDVELILDPPTTQDPSGGGDPLAFRRELLTYLRAQPTAPPPAATTPELALLEQIARLSARHRLALVPGAGLLFDALVCAGASARAVDPGVDCGDVARRSLSAARVGATLRRLGPDQAEELTAELTALAADLPGQLHKLLSDLADGSFSLNVSVAEVAQAERNRNRRTRVLTAAIVTVALSLLLSARHLPRVAGVSVAWAIGAALVVTYAWLAVQWRRLG